MSFMVSPFSICQCCDSARAMVLAPIAEREQYRTFSMCKDTKFLSDLQVFGQKKVLKIIWILSFLILSPSNPHFPSRVRVGLTQG